MTDEDDPEPDEISIAIEDEDGEVEVLDGIESVDFEVEDDTDERTVSMMDWGTGDTFSGSFEVEVEDSGLFESLLAGELFESGLSMELADDLDSLLTDDGSTMLTPRDFLSPDNTPEVVDELEVDAEKAEKLLKVIYQKMNEYQSEYAELPEQLVLGLPQFKAVEAYTRDKHEESAQQRLPVDEIVVVSGPQIQCVRDPYTMVAESLSEEDDAE